MARGLPIVLALLLTCGTAAWADGRAGKAGWEAAPGLRLASAAQPAFLPSRQAIREAQTLLDALGYRPGPADGIWGPRTAKAYAAFLRDAGLAPRDVLTPDALRAMRDRAEKGKAPPTSTKEGAGVSKAKARPEAKTAAPARTAKQDVPGCDEWNTAKFFRAATRAEVRECLGKGADAKATDKGGVTPLHNAASATRDPEIINILVQAGADPNVRTKRGKYTPLHLAARRVGDGCGSRQTGESRKICSIIAENLLQAGADPAAVAIFTALDYAVQRGNNFVAEALLKSAGTAVWREKFGVTRLHAAVVTEGAAAVSSLLKAGADPNAGDYRDSTPLHWAASSSSDPAIIAALLRAGADPNARNRIDLTPLHWAAWGNRLSNLRTLLQHGAEVDAVGDRNTFTPLNAAAETGASPDVIKALLEAGADPEARASYLELTPLHYTARNGDPPAMRALLQGGADPNSRDGEGNTPLHRAFSAGSAEAVLTLLERGADPNIKNSDGKVPEDVDRGRIASRPKVRAALAETGEKLAEARWKAIETGRQASARLLEITGSGATLDDRMAEILALLGKGADPNVTGARGRTPVHHAASRAGSQQALRLLLKRGGRTDVQDADGNTPLHLAADGSPSGPFFDSIGAIEVLLSHKANPNAVNGDGETPLHIAVTTHKIEAEGLRLLLQAGADPSRIDARGATPFHIALRGSLRYAAIRELLQGGADVGKQTRDGLTALQLFVCCGHDSGDIVAALLNAGADPDGKYADGNTPLHEAIRSGGTGSGKVKVVEALLDGGANPCIRDAGGHIPYQIVKDASGWIRRVLDRAGGHELACEERVRKIQAALACAGYDPGPIDGVPGGKTDSAVKKWQKANGHAATGELSEEALAALVKCKPKQVAAPPEAGAPAKEQARKQPASQKKKRIIRIRRKRL